MKLYDDATKIYEAKIQQTLRKVKHEFINQEHQKHYPTGLHAGRFYRTGKTHELFRNTTINGLSIRAIVLNNGPASYQRTKYLDHLLSALRQRQFTVKSTKHFRSKVKQMELRKSYRMISFDEKPLFTYLPLSYTFDKEIETSLT